MNKTKEEVIAEASSYFSEGYACTQSVLLPFAEALGLDKKSAKAIAVGFGGGMGRMRRTCGAVTGAFMVLGLKFGQMDEADKQQKLQVYRYVRECNKRFEAIHGSTVCKELLTSAAKSSDRDKAKHVCDDCVRDATAIAYDMITE